MSSNKDSSVERAASAASLSQDPCDSRTDPHTDMKRAAAKQLIEKYYYQITDGCGNPDCDNEHCASSKSFQLSSLSRNEAAIKSVELFKGKAVLCESKPSKIAKSALEAVPEDVQDGVNNTALPSTSKVDRPASEDNSPTGTKEEEFLTEKKVISMIEECSQGNNWSPLIRTIGQVYNNPEILKKCFLKDKDLTCDPDKDLDSMDCSKTCQELRENKFSLEKDEISLDLDALRRVYVAMFDIPGLPFQSALINAIVYLSDNLGMLLRHHSNTIENDADFLNIFVGIMEIPNLHSPEFLEDAFPAFTRAMGHLPVSAQAKLARLWSKFPVDRLRSLLEALQQLITVRVISQQWSQRKTVNDDSAISSATKVMKNIYYACLYGGRRDSPTLVEQETLEEENDSSLTDFLQGAVGHEPKEKRTVKEDPLAKELKVKALDCHKPLIPFEEFINEPLNEQIEVDQDFMYYKQDDKFSFINYSFILTTTTKNLGMYFDNRIRMLNERRTSLLQSLVHGAPTMPYLRLRIRRDHVIDDALVGLEMAAMDNPQDLKKQLYVEFEGEQGIDEGGVSKEFFQLVIEELFNPDFGMFSYDEETNNYWFNAMSFENDAQFMLIGIILGLAIYNHIILDVQFPMVVYRKLMGKKGNHMDMFISHPTLARSLENLLEYQGNVEEDFMINFVAGDQDVFGSALTHVLKEGGDSIPVTNNNRQEYVDLYADYLLNKSIEKQFRAFKRGFQMVTDESPLRTLFRPEEVEMLVCGSKHFDFHALEEATEYDGGFNSSSPTITHFWEIVHEFGEEEQRKLLQFTTGSDRVPVGGLAKLKLIIARNGPDSDRLPTSHTCFNVLLLPDYSSKEKLKEQILKAITHAKGFGML